MWAVTGNHDREWTYADVILSNTAPFRVTFQAEVGGDMWTDIALDDISYTEECVAEGEDEVSTSSFVWIPPPPISCPFGAAANFLPTITQLCFHNDSAAV